MEERKPAYPQITRSGHYKGSTKAALQDNEVRQTQADRQPGSPSLQGT